MAVKPALSASGWRYSMVFGGPVASRSEDACTARGGCLHGLRTVLARLADDACTARSGCSCIFCRVLKPHFSPAQGGKWFHFGGNFCFHRNSLHRFTNNARGRYPEKCGEAVRFTALRRWRYLSCPRRRPDGWASSAFSVGRRWTNGNIPLSLCISRLKVFVFVRNPCRFLSRLNCLPGVIAVGVPLGVHSPLGRRRLGVAGRLLEAG